MCNVNVFNVSRFSTNSYTFSFHGSHFVLNLPHAYPQWSTLCLDALNFVRYSISGMRRNVCTRTLPFVEGASHHDTSKDIRSYGAPEIASYAALRACYVLCDPLSDGLDGFHRIGDKLNLEEVDVVENIARLHHHSNLNKRNVYTTGRIGLCRAEWVRLGWVGLGWVGLGWVGLGWVGLGWVGLGCDGLQKIRSRR